MKTIERTDYLRKLTRWKGKDVIKVITGIRRCGKSTLLKQFQEKLISQGVNPQHIISINFEDYSFIELVDPKKLHEYVIDKIDESKKIYLFLDEIQNVNDFQRVVDSFYLRKNIDLYITGSNANLLSGDLATMLSGRYVAIEMLPLSFGEFVEAKDHSTDLANLYRQYIETSSFPYALELMDDREALQEYLDGIYSTVVLKDVIGHLVNVAPLILESIVRFLMSSIGSRISTKKIADTLVSQGRKVDVRTVEKYLNGLLGGYIFYRAKRYDIKGKQHLKTLEKYYCADIGLRNALIGGRGFDAGHVLENVIYLELLRRGYAVSIGKIGEMEIDFVAEKSGTIEYYQVSASTRDPETLKRELRPLQLIKDNYPKFIFTLDDDPVGNHEGILRMNALDWLVDSY